MLPHSPQIGRRLVWFWIILAVQFLYVPINRLVHGGIVFKTPFDDFIPLWPIWALPYQICIIGWVVSLTWGTIKMDRDMFRAFVIGALTIMLTSYVIYLLFPTYVQRPILAGHTWDIEMIRCIYGVDQPYNAFPSSHTYMVIFVSLFWWRWYPRYGWLWLGISVIVLLSTLFTRQHYLPDLVGGCVLAWAGYRFGFWWVARQPREKFV